MEKTDMAANYYVLDVTITEQNCSQTQSAPATKLFFRMFCFY